jgi:hypothetical protein
MLLQTVQALNTAVDLLTLRDKNGRRMWWKLENVNIAGPRQAGWPIEDRKGQVMDAEIAKHRGGKVFCLGRPSGVYLLEGIAATRELESHRMSVVL